MGRSKLSIPMNKYFGPKHKIRVPYMHYSKILGKYSSVYNKKYSELVFR